MSPAEVPSGPPWTTKRRIVRRTGCPRAASCSACLSTRGHSLLLLFSKKRSRRRRFRRDLAQDAARARGAPRRARDSRNDDDLYRSCKGLTPLGGRNGHGGSPRRASHWTAETSGDYQRLAKTDRIRNASKADVLASSRPILVGPSPDFRFSDFKNDYNQLELDPCRHPISRGARGFKKWS